MRVIHGPFQLVRADLPKCTLRINFSVKAWILPKQNQRYFSMGTALLEIHKLDPSGAIMPGQFKLIKDPKTTFDPSAMSLDEWMRRGGDAANSALNLGHGSRSGRLFEGPDEFGVIWQGWLDEAGAVKSVWPKM